MSQRSCSVYSSLEVYHDYLILLKTLGLDHFTAESTPLSETLVLPPTPASVPPVRPSNLVRDKNNRLQFKGNTISNFIYRLRSWTFTNKAQSSQRPVAPSSRPTEPRRRPSSRARRDRRTKKQCPPRPRGFIRRFLGRLGCASTRKNRQNTSTGAQSGSATSRSRARANTGHSQRPSRRRRNKEGNVVFDRPGWHDSIRIIGPRRHLSTPIETWSERLELLLSQSLAAHPRSAFEIHRRSSLVGRTVAFAAPNSRLHLQPPTAQGVQRALQDAAQEVAEDMKRVRTALDALAFQGHDEMRHRGRHSRASRIYIMNNSHIDEVARGRGDKLQEA